MTEKNYDLGDLVRCTGNFKNTAGADINPTTITCQIKKPDSTITSYTYGTDAELIRDSTGNYHLDVNANAVGRWYYRFSSTGTGQAAAEGSFRVLSSKFS